MEIRDEEFDTVREHLDEYPIFENALSEDWTEANILNFEQREDKHPLFWELLQSDKVQTLSKALRRLQEECYFNSLCSKIKNHADRDNFRAFLTELKVLHFYKTQEDGELIVKDYEPSVPDREGRKNDILLEIGGDDYYLEILTLLEDRIERENRELESQIDEQLNTIGDHSFIISYRYFSNFSEADIDGFSIFTEESIEYAKSTNLEYYELEFEKDDAIKAILKLYPSRSNTGGVGIRMGDVREINNDIRLKSRMLTKIDKQLSEHTKNVLLANLRVPTAGLDDFFNAILGKESVRVNTETMEPEAVRKPNGIIHDPDGRAKYVSVFIGFNKGNYNSREKIFVTDANHPIEEQYWDFL